MRIQFLDHGHNVSELGRCLTKQEMFTADVCGLGLGWDVDDEELAPVQFCHIVEGGEHGQIHPICGAKTLWFYDWHVKSEDRITCNACLAKLPGLVSRAHRRAHLT